MEHKNLVRRKLGHQLALLRLEQNKTLHHVAKANNISPYALDQIEMGMNAGWRKYNQILEYYNCDIRLVEKV